MKSILSTLNIFKLSNKSKIKPNPTLILMLGTLLQFYDLMIAVSTKKRLSVILAFTFGGAEKRKWGYTGWG